MGPPRDRRADPAGADALQGKLCVERTQLFKPKAQEPGLDAGRPYRGRAGADVFESDTYRGISGNPAQGYRVNRSSLEIERTAPECSRAVPVFVVGSARSGTTLLYHMLLSSGGFAHFFGEPAVFDLLVPKFGDLTSVRNRERVMNRWMGSKMHRASGLDGELMRRKVLAECNSNADFLRLLMQEVARQQGVPRWAVWGPDNLLYMREIKSQMPDARFLHVIR